MAGLRESIKLEIEESVPKGGPFLDENYAGWKNRVDPDTADMKDPSACVLAQASGVSYHQAADDHNLGYHDLSALGFDVPMSTRMEEYDPACKHLVDEWRRQYFDN